VSAPVRLKPIDAIRLEHLLDHQARRLLEPAGVVGEERLVDQVRGGDAALDR
jgi:hypothetical protein